MKGSCKLASMAILATSLAAPTAGSAADAARHSVPAAGAISRDALDTRAVHLARAALEGQQVQELSREELVSLLVLMSLPQAPHPQHS